MRLNLVLKPALLALCILLTSNISAKETLVGMNQKVYKLLNDAQTLIDSEELYKSRTLLENALEKLRLSGYETAHILSMIAVIEYELENPEAAKSSLELALEQEKLPEGFQASLALRTAQLSLSAGQYDQAAAYIDKVLMLENPARENTAMLAAQIYYFKEDYATALHHANNAMFLVTQFGKNPKENLLQLLSAIHHSRDDYPQMLKVQLQLLSLYPRPKYVTNTAAIYGQQENTENQLILNQALADLDQLQNPSHIKQLASLLILHETPHFAAILLEKALDEGKLEKDQKNYERIAQARLLAGDYRESIHFQSLAADMDSTGQGHTRVASTLMSLGEWQRASTELEKSLDKGELTNTGRVYVMKGMTEYRLSKYKESLQSFKSATDFPEVKTVASQWLAYVEKEVEKQEALAQIQ